jgi:NodT family efflux transporter outer membrane factor (OMF) lipoprotein
VPATAAISPPLQWRGQTGAASDTGADWWRHFCDPALDKLIEVALANNTDIGIASERVLAAGAQLKLATANSLPNATLAAQGGRDEDVSPFGTPEYQYSSVGHVDLTYDLDVFGELRALMKAARAGLIASEALRANTRLIVASTTATVYINLLAADARLKILRDTLTARNESLKYATRRAQTGYAPMLDLRQAQVEFHAAEQLIPVTQLAITQLEDGLNVLLGENPQPVARAISLDAIEPPEVPIRLPAELLRRRPDIVVAEQQLVAADSTLDAARAAFMPHVELSASGGYAASTLFPSPIKLFQLGGSILAPIFDAGRLRAQETVAIARRDEAAFAYKKVTLEAFSDVENELAAESRLRQKETALTAQRDALVQSLALAKNRYRAGYSPYLEQLDAERSLLGANLQLAQLRADRLNAAVSLYQAMGGAWPGNDADTAAR